RPILTTLSPLMIERSTRRDVAVLDVSLDALRSAARAAEVSINDAFLAAVLLGMAKYHDRHGTEAPELRVTLPISLRAKGDPIGGNRITLARMTLPTSSSDPAALMRDIKSVVAEWRAEPAIPFSPAIAGAFNVLPASTLGDMLKHVDFVASNVPGSPIPAFVAGAEILGFYAFGPTLGAAFNVTLMSHMSRCCVSIHADAAAVPDLAECKAAIVEGFEEVLACSSESKLPDDAVITSLGGPVA
uniref:WS/DGAT domain-containing protein n=1 Tax=Aldersonia kunmingensis TaxID=408066 RepID=UPI000ACBBC59